MIGNAILTLVYGVFFGVGAAIGALTTRALIDEVRLRRWSAQAREQERP